MIIPHRFTLADDEATLLNPVEDALIERGSQGQPGSHCLVVNRSADYSIFIGGPGVTAETGVEILPGLSVGFPVTAKNDDLYGIVATGESADVHVLQTGV